MRSALYSCYCLVVDALFHAKKMYIFSNIVNEYERVE